VEGERMTAWDALPEAGPDLLVHVAALTQVAGFLLRDQLRLRALVALGGALYLLYYYLAPAAPLWAAMFWSATMVCVNLVMIALIARNRSRRALSDDALRMYGAFSAMEPGDFRRLLRLARVSDADAPVVLTRLGEAADRVFYVIHGTVEIARADRTLTAQGPLFIGELRYLLGGAASATVTATPGARVAEWDAGALRRFCARHDRIARALESAFNRDLAMKIHGGAHEPLPAQQAAPRP